MDLAIPISNHPITGLSRKVVIKSLNITGHFITIDHYTFNYDQNGNRVDDKSSVYVLQNRTTIESYIDLNTGAHVEPVGTENGSPVFAEGVNPISEFQYLKSIPKSSSNQTTVWGCIEDVITMFIATLDSEGKFDQ